MNENIQYIKRAVDVLEEQIKPLDLRIVFDYETKFIDERENEFETVYFLINFCFCRKMTKFFRKNV